jgi:hypothetical protein
VADAARRKTVRRVEVDRGSPHQAHRRPDLLEVEDPVSLSMRYLSVVAAVAGTFELASAAWLNAPDLVGQLSAGAVGVALLACAWATWTRGSFVAATVVGVLLLVDVASIPFFERSTWSDWVIQLVFGAVGVVGIVAWCNVLRTRRRRPAPGAAVRG